MIVKDKEKVSQPIDASLHYKMYKDGKHWVTAGITTLMFSGLILGTQTTAHADTATASTSGNGQAQATTGGNAVTQTTAQAASTSNANTAAASQTTANTVSATAAAASTATQRQSAGTITQPVAVDHSQLDQAVAAAKQAGLNPQQQPTTSSTVAPSEVESAKANIESDYASQAAKLQEAADQQQTINKYNGSKGDTSALDAAVKEAQNTPGLTVTQDQTKTTTLKANDKSGIANWSSSTATDYASQVDAINKAIAAQKQNETNYQSELNSLATDHHVTGQINWDNGGYMNAHPSYDITWHYDLQRKKVVVTNVHLTIASGLAPKTGGGFWDAYVIRRSIDPEPAKDSRTFSYGRQGDVTGVDGNSLKNDYFPGSIGFYAHNNKTQAEVKAVNDYHGSYDAVQNNDGSWSIITVYDRYGTSAHHYNPVVGEPAWAEWGKTNPIATITLPKLVTSQVDYHYNVSSVNRLRSLVT